jgi:hypothetical protein
VRQVAISTATALVLILVSGCGTDPRAAREAQTTHTDAVASTTSTQPSTTTSTTDATPATHVPTTAVTTTAGPPARPPTSSPSTTAVTPAPGVRVSMVTAADLGRSWHVGCPVGPAQLRRLTLSFWGFDGRTHRGQLIVNTLAVSALSSVFTRLYAAHFPIHKMVTIDHYAGTGVQLDDESTADDNTAAFNCRNAVNPGGPPSWSEHAYGEAVDVNPVENPYVESNGVVDPPNGARYVNRSVHRLGMAYVGSPLNTAFAAVGWAWGGNWSGNPDYQHFSVNGQ